jgi:hypothetical protein
MANSISTKLKIKADYQLLTLNAPSGFKKILTDLPGGVNISDKCKNYNQVHWFVLNRAQMEEEVEKVLKLLKPDVTFWVYYPKGTSNIQTDLSRDKGWDRLLANDDKLTWISLISFDETWSVFGFRAKTEADKLKESKAVEPREVFNWVDPATKTVRLPPDLDAALKTNKKAAAFFQTLSFTNKKEYIEWVVTAKREEPRNERIK